MEHEFFKIIKAKNTAFWVFLLVLSIVLSVKGAGVIE